MNDHLTGGSTERAEHGCIVTFENEHGRTLTIYRQGAPREGLRQACAIALARDETFRLVSYSTPYTIYTDLIGRGLGTDPTRKHQSIELMVAAQAGLRQMVHARLLLASEGRRSERSTRHSARHRKGLAA